MIKDVAITDIPHPYRDGIEWPQTWPFSPFLLRDEFLDRGWYPFEDWYPELDNLEALFSTDFREVTYLMEFPTESVTPQCAIIFRPDAAELTEIREKIKYGGIFLWNNDGVGLVNYFSDFMMTNLGDKASEAVFGASLPLLFSKCVNIFTDSSRNSIHVNDVQLIDRFMTDCRKTWRRGELPC